jgi:hypothetical protein
MTLRGIVKKKMHHGATEKKGEEEGEKFLRAKARGRFFSVSSLFLRASVVNLLAC